MILQIRDELREACQADKSLRDEQAAREELQETLARETAHHRALQKQVIFLGTCRKAYGHILWPLC